MHFCPPFPSLPAVRPPVRRFFCFCSGVVLVRSSAVLVRSVVSYGCPLCFLLYLCIAFRGERATLFGILRPETVGVCGYAESAYLGKEGTAREKTADCIPSFLLCNLQCRPRKKNPHKRPLAAIIDMHALCYILIGLECLMASPMTFPFIIGIL